jgi:hypothetical protein
LQAKRLSAEVITTTKAESNPHVSKNLKNAIAASLRSSQ